MVEIADMMAAQRDMLLQQQVLLDRMAERVFEKPRNVNIFPLQTMEDVDQADEKAEKILRDDLVIALINLNWF